MRDANRELQVEVACHVGHTNIFWEWQSDLPLSDMQTILNYPRDKTNAHTPTTDHSTSRSASTCRSPHRLSKWETRLKAYAIKCLCKLSIVQAVHLALPARLVGSDSWESCEHTRYVSWQLLCNFIGPETSQFRRFISLSWSKAVARIYCCDFPATDKL